MSTDSDPVQRVTAEARALYGGDVPRRGGVLHVASAWASPRGGLLNLRIGPETPRSETDAFVLALARARADAVVTTGRILREEPALRFEADGAHGEALAAWRRERMARREPPLLVVLTRGRRFDVEHPALAPGRTVLVTSRGGMSALAAAAARRGLELVARSEPGLLDTLAWLRGERALDTVLVEAGPRTSGVLYEVAGRLDESLLSLCRAPELAASARGERVPDETARARAGLREASRCERAESTGAWTFLRYVRR